MEYLVLARKWRPQIFEDVVGQDHVVKTLRNAVKLDRVAHAYIFSGPRGTGKTSVARILAKSLNCEKGPTEVPCNQCANCREITEGVSLDVREIDGASNRGIDEIRELRENIKFSPVSSRYKIYIIDEVHMLTTPAFNALLKTLEEPPPHVVFVFATTEIYKVPATILSRCQHFDFKRISVRQIADNLGHISKEEGISISDAGLSWIAREGEGSLRDAQSIFDQVIAYAGTDIKDGDVEELLDLKDRRLIFELSGAVLERDGGACLKIIDEAYYSGVDIKHFYQMFLGHLMNLLTVKITDGDSAREGRLVLSDLPDHEMADLKKMAQGASRDTIQRLLDILMEEENDIRRSMEPRINLEYAVVKMAYLEPLIPVDEIISRMEGLETRLAGSDRQDFAVTRQGGADQAVDTGTARQEARTDQTVNTGTGTYERAADDSLWQDLKGFIKEKNPPLSSKINSGKFLSYEGDCLKIGFPKDYIFLDDIRSTSQMDILAQMAGEFLGKKTTIDIKLLEKGTHNSGGTASGATGAINNTKNEALQHPLVQKVMDVFKGAEILDVRINGSRR
ncbi:MAG: DNA polymerase III subunit gamma/tau [Deltaproteobacteria bacterium]|nr:DNA polymerase III subunit gamma/tau [Deltaproteobacteria bacterium]